MRQTKDIMGMHVTVEIKNSDTSLKNNQSLEVGFNMVFDYLKYIDETFSTYKPQSEISKINRGEIEESEYSKDMVEIFKLAEQTKQDTAGFFNIHKPDDSLDPSGLVKGWAIWQAGLLLENNDFENFFIDAGGDIQTHIPNPQLKALSWRVGIRNPFNLKEIVKVLQITNHGVATSGIYERGQHIYNPHQPKQELNEIMSLTVVGPNVYEADRFATAAFAMGKSGINFIESQPNLEGYMINSHGIATMTTGFDKFVTN